MSFYWQAFKAIGKFVIAAFTGFEVAELLSTPEKSISKVETEFYALKNELKAIPNTDEVIILLQVILALLGVFLLLCIAAKSYAAIRKCGKKAGLRSLA